MKLIDILNMISKGELNFGTQFRYKGDVYVYKRSCILSKENANLIQIFGYDSLNEEVELIEPDHFADVGKMATEKIKELDILGIGESQNIDNLGLANSIVDLRNEIREIQHKLNEVIRRINNVR